jgi:cyclopropane-fatty-acyl-phospholipid synthase
MDFQFDTTADGRTLKMLNTIDEFTREALAINVDRSADADADAVGVGVGGVLDRLVLQRGAPAYLRLDNGPEFVAQAVNDWCRFNGAGSLFIDPGSQWQKRLDRVVQRPATRRTAQLVAVRLAARSPRNHRRLALRLQRQQTPTPPMANSPQPNSPYSGPRPTPSRIATGPADGLPGTSPRRGPGKGNTNMADGLTPHFAEVQAHYDLSDDFFRLFLDPTQTYTCAYFLGDDMTLEEAQIAKIDLSLSKLGLQPGMTLLDIGCGWGAAMRRAIEKCDVNVIGLTLSKNQAAFVEQLLAASHSPRSKRVLLEGWERFYEPVDRIVAIGPLEHVGYDRYDAFFKRAYDLLPGDGTMLLHTITVLSEKEIIESGLPLTMDLIDFSDFMKTEIFPGGFLPTIQMVKEHALKAGFKLKRRQSLQRHYAKTLDIWAAALEAHKSEAIAIQSEEVYERYMKYLTGCADLFRKGYTDLNQFTLRK